MHMRPHRNRLPESHVCGCMFLYLHVKPSRSPTCMFRHSCMHILREDLSTGYGLRSSTEIYGSKREKTIFHQSRNPVLQFPLTYGGLHCVHDPGVADTLDMRDEGPKPPASARFFARPSRSGRRLRTFRRAYPAVHRVCFQTPGSKTTGPSKNKRITIQWFRCTSSLKLCNTNGKYQGRAKGMGCLRGWMRERGVGSQGVGPTLTTPFTMPSFTHPLSIHHHSPKRPPFCVKLWYFLFSHGVLVLLSMRTYCANEAMLKMLLFRLSIRSSLCKHSCCCYYLQSKRAIINTRPQHTTAYHATFRHSASAVTLAPAPVRLRYSII